MSEENVKVVKDLYEAFGKGNVHAVLGSFDKQIEWREADNFIYADRNPYIGPQAILEGVFMRLGAQWDGFAVEPERFLDAGDTVVVLGHYTGIYRRSGKKVRAQMAHVWDLRDGKILKFQQYTDTLQFGDAIVHPE
jgi:uncharacterized protein